MARVLYLVFAILVAVIGLAFHVRNNQEVTLDYFAGTVNLDLSWVMVAMLVLGVTLGVMVMTGRALKQGHEIRRLHRLQSQADRELSTLRAVALKDGS